MYKLDNLIKHLPQVEGRYTENALLSKITWFRVGGPADVLYKPSSIDDLSRFLNQLPTGIPYIPMGVGSNVIIRDGGVEGVVLRLGRGFTDMSFDKDVVKIGSGCLDLNVALFAAQHSLTGLEFLSGIPGTIGGALRMNAGAYGTEIKDVLKQATAVDRQGKTHILKPADFGFRYRGVDVPSDWIFTGAEFYTSPGEQDAIEARIIEIKQQREASQPVRSRTGGSTFANPYNNSAWKLIDHAGCRGLTVGGAMVSELHCNFMINTGDATADNIEALGETVRHRVLNKTGILLDWEIKRLGLKGHERGCQ
jgi:UDP-N-acetylmuramate dehydrogenase